MRAVGFDIRIFPFLAGELWTFQTADLILMELFVRAGTDTHLDSLAFLTYRFCSVLTEEVYSQVSFLEILGSVGYLYLLTNPIKRKTFTYICK